MSSVIEQQSKPAPAVPANPNLWDRDTTCAFFGGIDSSTLYRGIAAKRYPRPVLVSAHIARWLPDECEAALQRMIKQRGSKRPEYKGRQRGRKTNAQRKERAAASKTAAAEITTT